MPANHKRSWRPQLQHGNQTRMEWAAGPSPAAAVAVAVAAGDGEGVDSPADFPYDLHNRKPGDKSHKSGLGKMHLVHMDKNCDMWNLR